MFTPYVMGQIIGGILITAVVSRFARMGLGKDLRGSVGAFLLTIGLTIVVAYVGTNGEPDAFLRMTGLYPSCAAIWLAVDAYVLVPRQGYKCEKCGTVNRHGAGTCGCGAVLVA